MLTTWKPLFPEFDRLLGGVGRRGADDVVMLTPLADISETKEGFTLRLDLPGVKADDIDVKVEVSRLTVRAKRALHPGAEGESYHLTEVPHGLYERTFRLPTSLDGPRVDARYDAGVLTLLVPRREEAKPHKISVKT